MNTLKPRTGMTMGLAFIALSQVTACADDNVSPDTENPATIALEVVQSGLASPVFVTSPPGDTGRLFVVEQGGLIRIIQGGSVLATPFLDLSDSISGGSEQGLLGLAFHPSYATNGYFFVNYTNPAGATRVKRYTVSGSAYVADATSGQTILAIPQPYSNHNGGMVAFGPDGRLYVGMGDGGDASDPHDHGQSPATLLGSMLRLDVDGASPYAIPSDNPFFGHATYRQETWAYGLRNPWRFSFDRATGDLYIGDVGQSRVEEVSFQPVSSVGGENYGWKTMEGSICHSPSPGCSTAGLTLPIQEYGHSAGCSISGGYVYRGSQAPTLLGRYFFADYCSGWIRSFKSVNGVATDVQDHSADVAFVPQISSFGEDAAGELYLVSLGGTVYRITEGAAGPRGQFAATSASPPSDSGGVDR